MNGGIIISGEKQMSRSYFKTRNTIMKQAISNKLRMTVRERAAGAVFQATTRRECSFDPRFWFFPCGKEQACLRQ
jgi:hypothetical protein